MSPFEKMGDRRWIDVRDKHGGLFRQRRSGAILIEFLSVMESVQNRRDPPRVIFCDGDCCCYPARSADFERFLCMKTFPWSIVLTDEPPDEETQWESRVAAGLFDV